MKMCLKGFLESNKYNEDRFFLLFVCIAKDEKTDLMLFNTSSTEENMLHCMWGLKEINEVQVPLLDCCHSISCKQRYSCLI